jgi:hypothetical protein
MALPQDHDGTFSLETSYLELPQQSSNNHHTDRKSMEAPLHHHHHHHHHVDYRSQGGPCLDYVDIHHLQQGQSLYLGGEEAPNGKIYCIPGHATRVLCLDPRNDTVTCIGKDDLEGKFKWLRGVRVGNIIYGLPCHADSVLRIDTSTDTVTVLPIPYQDFYPSAEQAQEQRNMEWKYHGGTSFHTTNAIYAVPQSAWHVLKIQNDVCSFLTHDAFPQRYKWYGGIISGGALYGIPHNASAVLRIDGDTETVSLHGSFTDGNHKWHGAAQASNGTIVAVPANADSVLLIEPSKDHDSVQVHEIKSPLIRTGTHRSDGKYKYLGAVTGADGHVYCFPSGAEHVLQVQALPKMVHLLSPNLKTHERIHQNKWQNGIAIQDYIYAIPLAAESVLRINVRSGEVTTWKLPQPSSGLAKWEGGVLCQYNHAIYSVPNNFKAILRIANVPMENQKNTTTCKQVPTFKLLAGDDDDDDDDDYYYKSGIPTLRSSAHRVKYSPKHRESCALTKKLPQTFWENRILDYDMKKYDWVTAIRNFLKSSCNPEIVGSFRSDRLEDLEVPLASLQRRHHGGICEDAQDYLSQQLERADHVMELFDDFCLQVAIPHLKHLLIQRGAIPENTSTTFYYQRPPTLRLQPGPARAHVKPHCDSVYGHQDGEVNFWLPLTDRSLTLVDLHVDQEAVPVQVGQVLRFHGTSRPHFVNSNPSLYTRVSLDFRIGIQGYFDPDWAMVGTTADHARRQVVL